MRPNPFAVEAESAFRQFVLQADYPCLGAKAAANSDSCTVKVYPHFGSDESALILARDLADFAQTQTKSPGDFATFAAVFQEPRSTTEVQFEELLWKQLRALREQDAQNFGWDSSVSSDPADPHFSFSCGGEAMYVIGLHANSSRTARRFPWPTLVFNPHRQFEKLRAEGKWKRMQGAIRQRDAELQGTINPMLSDFGEQSEARQYSGRAVDGNWTAPFPAQQRKCPFAH
jgi:FPC/CPF motif-containing protein YcgG